MFSISLEKISEISKIENFKQQFRDKFIEKLKVEKHYFKKDNEIYLTKNGLIRIGFLTQNENISDYIDSLETNIYDNRGVEKIYRDIEKTLNNFAEKLSENSDDVDLETLDKFVTVFDKFVNLKHSERIDLNFVSETRESAYKFASKTEDDAYKFASNMGKDAYNFTSETRDKAHDFVMKAEDDAYKFASNMGKDAYSFASKGMEYGYHFASRGMKYGYEFASKGEEVGEMANRVLWMASEIGIMADRIGEMSDRIVHTEHLIVQTAMLIQNFGLLIDGTVKHISESILYSLTLLLNKEFQPLQTTSKHLDIISDITKEIIKNNHEYDMAVLEKQGNLRKITISALDKIDKDF